MRNISAKILNLIFNPLCMITYIMVMFLFFNNFFNFIYDIELKLIILAFVLITTVFIPALSYMFIVKTKLLNLELNKRLLRFLSLLFMSLFIFLTARSLESVNMPYIIVRFLYFNAAFVLITSFFPFINYAAIGIGEIIGLYTCWMRYIVADNIYVLCVLLLLFAIIGFSQISLNKTKVLSFVLETLIGAFFAIFAFLL